MLEYRKARPEERQEYLDFADLVFKYTGTEKNFEAYIPKVYGPDVDSADMQYIAKDERGIVGLVATLPQTLNVGGETLKTGYVGTVSTHPQARGEGHMKKLMKLSMDEMRANGTDISFLGGQRQRYQYYGYMIAGVEHQMRVSDSNVRHALKDVDASGITFAEIASGSEWEAKAAEMHRNQLIYFTRDRFAVNCRNYLGKPYVILEDGEYAGYLVCGETKDYIAEIMTVSLSVLDKALKAWMAQNEFSRIGLVMPDWQTDVIRHLNVYNGGAEYTSGFMAKIFNYPHVVGAMLKAKAKYTWLQDGSTAFDVEGQCFTVTVKAGEVAVVEGGCDPIRLTEPEADQLFLFPFDYENRPEVPHNWFPLPFHAARPDDF